jgi:putative (di)nucleoside polyphosphate hydrolase
MIDSEGFRLNVGIILANEDGQVFWAKRVGQNAWQFPQGGIRAHESPEQAMLRDLAEEIGLLPEHVEIIGRTRHWLRYRLPPYLIRQHKKPLCIGQKQLWYVLRLLGHESVVQLDYGEKPEFDSWRWVNYWYPLKEVVFFKRRVYERALQELAPLILPNSTPSFKALEPAAKRRRDISLLGGKTVYLRELPSL